MKKNIKKAEPLLFFGLKYEEWILLFLASAPIIFLIDFMGFKMTWWSGAGLFFSLLVLGRLCLMGNRFIAAPDLIAFAGCVEWIIAPWLAEIYPPDFPLFQRVVPLEEYMAYVVPATALFWLGLHLPFRRLLQRPLLLPKLRPPPARALRMLDAMIVLGILLDYMWQYTPSSLGFIVYLLSCFRFFAALCWMLCRAPGWWLRVGVVFAHIIILSTAVGLFYQIVHWAGWFVLVYALQQGWRWRIALVIGMGLVFLGMIQTVKGEYRSYLEESPSAGTFQKVEKFESLLEQRLTESGAMNSHLTINDVLVRFNQGWIIARIMDHVPKMEPYAKGATLKDAVLFTLVPRFLVPGKREGASREVFSRYSGIPLHPSTSMGLGVIGELYANFGTWGGVAATLAYGWIVGSIYGLFLRLSFKNIYWWGLGFIVLLPSVEPGWNIEDTSNHVFKAAILVFAVAWVVPWFKRFMAPQDQNLDPAPQKHHRKGKLVI